MDIVASNVSIIKTYVMSVDDELNNQEKKISILGNTVLQV